MPKPPETPPSSDIDGPDAGRPADGGGGKPAEPAELEDRARAESRGRPARTKR